MFVWGYKVLSTRLIDTQAHNLSLSLSLSLSQTAMILLFETSESFLESHGIEVRIVSDGNTGVQDFCSILQYLRRGHILRPHHDDDDDKKYGGTVIGGLFICP